MTLDRQGRAYAKNSSLSAGAWVELDDSFTCTKGKVQVWPSGVGWYFTCADGNHYLNSHLDEHDYLIGVYPVTDTELVTLENTDMVREWARKFSNMMVEASDMAKEVHSLRDAIQKITDALTVANEAAARAIEERNDAMRQRDRAIELRDQADHAYQTVNEQRVATARELQDARESLRVNKALLDNTLAKEEEYKQEIEEWTKDNAALKAEVFHATSGAASMVDAVKAEKEAIIASLRMEVQGLRETNQGLHQRYNTSEIDVLNLRKIISEAKIAAQGTVGVLAGEMAAE